MSETNYCKDCLNMNCPEGRVNCIYLDAIACHLYTNTPPTVFEKITASMETLANKLVYCAKTYSHVYELYMTRWFSSIIPDAVFDTYSEAYAATLKKLKEVEKDGK